MMQEPGKKLQVWAHKEEEEGGRNKHASKFYSDCADYFEHLRKTGATDYGFEDEYYFTMPAISGR